jgi:hypothetical protein
MRNKMPVVGKRYKHKYYTNFTIIILNSINNEFFFTDYGWKIHISDFWNWFEELPEDNLQEKYKLQIQRENENLKCLANELGADNQALQKELSEALAKVEIAKDAINFITDREESELVRDAKSAIIICQEAMDKLNKQGETHDI